MKKRFLALVVTLGICLGICAPTYAATQSDEEAPHFGANTVDLQSWHPTSGIQLSQARAEFERETGLVAFEEKQQFSILGGGSKGGFAIENTYYGLKDQMGNVIFPAEFISFEAIGEGRLIAKKADMTQKDKYGVWVELGYGVYDVTGREIFPPTAGRIEYANSDKRTFLVVPQNSGGVIGLYDWDFNQLVPPEYLRIEYMDDGYYLLHKGAMADGALHSYGVYRTGVGIIIPCNGEYTGISYLGSDMFRVRLSAFQYIAIDGNGKQATNTTYAGIRSYRDGFFAVAVPRSAADLQRAVQENAPSSAYNNRAGDFSDAPAYLTMGIVDGNGNLYSSFQHELAEIDASGLVHLQAWNGEHKSIVTNSGTNFAREETTKDYNDETILLGELSPTGETVTDLSRERGLNINGSASQPSVPTVGGFTDVLETDFFAAPVEWAVENGVTSGTSATTFSPGNTCTTAEILTFLWRASGSPAPEGANPFSDVAESDFSYQAALWAYENGLVSGTALQGSAPCTRADTVTYLWKLAGSPAAPAASFTDVPAGADYAPAVAWAVDQGVTSGTGEGAFSPDNTCTRGEIVTFLYRDLGQ